MGRQYKHYIENQYETAYFTVEASLILPMVMLFTVMMIFLSFYSYDRCILEHSAYEAAMRGTSNHFQSASEAEAAAYAAAGRLVEGKLLAMNQFRYDVSVNASKVTVTYYGIVNMPMLTWLKQYISAIDLNLEISKSASRCHQARTIREFRVLHSMVK